MGVLNEKYGRHNDKIITRKLHNIFKTMLMQSLVKKREIHLLVCLSCSLSIQMYRNDFFRVHYSFWAYSVFEMCIGNLCLKWLLIRGASMIFGEIQCNLFPFVSHSNLQTQTFIIALHSTLAFQNRGDCHFITYVNKVLNLFLCYSTRLVQTFDFISSANDNAALR